MIYYYNNCKIVPRNEHNKLTFFVFMQIYITISINKMRTLIYFFFFILNSSLITSVKYRCASDLGIPHLCLKITYEEKQQVKYVGGCREDQYCSETFNERNEAYCTPKIYQKTEGTQCYRNTECLSRMCMKNKCVALPDGLTCGSHFECGNQSYCDDSHICQKIKKEGEQCESDFACGFNLVCGNGHCQKMFSKDIGENSDNKN